MNLIPGGDEMRESLEKRLAELKAELEAGRKLAAELEQKQNSLQATMLRISGATQVLEELLATASSDGASPALGAPATPPSAAARLLG
jgi:hypothetical protein